MKLKKKHIILLFLGALICAISIAFTTVLKTQDEISAVLVTKERVFEAGNPIVLDFKLNTSVRTQLFIHSSFGSNVIDPDTHDTARFTVPEFMAKKKGLVSYTLLGESGSLYEGEIRIISNTKTKVHLESYIGPPSIIAGGEDYTMQIIVSTDSFDNPLPDSTAVLIRHQFLDIEKERILQSKDMIGWANIFSYDQSGRILLFSKVGKTVSKEFSVEVYPSLPQNFEIRSNRKHAYADGNQITELITSIIKDEYGNIVSDGSLVKFVIKDEKGQLLHTQGSTVNGQAVGKILHPDHKDTWQIKAYVPGMAESNILTIAYTQVLDDFEVKFDNDNREITIGPLISFMEQLIPDGTIVKMDIFKDNQKIDTKVKTSSHGLVRFLLQDGFYASGNYDMQIKALGIQKEFKNITLK
ncbi:hypothetical protein IWQ47_001722 [Aquimarina sp. EL_43]|uniref:hypothetical protein n=1 Tax=unclassified Aquimarina TaxID=2627091 RepID=UPI001A34C64D|nr:MULTISPECIES: hypothetical protein [unclassified Aquimarina]MBG6130195.1 hypothetical protein [Aquimarina sp. EL_35]MBG6148975.1 hypothetical protein [Aquimarina sp. EL_32]MBG6168651.1 hypothetical protein [Aquimarina sp. EL_43]